MICEILVRSPLIIGKLAGSFLIYDKSSALISLYPANLTPYKFYLLNTTG